jgi:hypothetical protein
LRKGSLIAIGVVSAIIVIAVIIASSYVPVDTGLPPAQNGSGDDQVADDDSKATSAGTIRQVMTLRTDLSGERVTVDRPFFLSLKDSTDSAANGTLNATEVLKVSGASPADVDVRTFEAGSLMTSWMPMETADGAEGTIYRSGSAYFEIDGDATVLIMVIISAPGTYSVSVNASDAVNGTSLAPPVTMDIAVEDAVTPYLFAELGFTEYSGEWTDHVANSSSMSFTLGAKTTDLWKSEAYSTRYNWTVTVINPDGMIAYDDLAPYNTGAVLDPANLVNTSVDSTWWEGSGYPFHVIWDSDSGVSMDGSAVTTPTVKELTQGGGIRAAWMDGTWEPYGDGGMTFHQTGHYVIMFTLTKNGVAVSAPLVLETVVY